MKTLLVLIALSTLTSCYTIYSPTSPNFSYFKKKYELHAGGTLTESGIQFASAASLSNHVGAQYDLQQSHDHFMEGVFGVFNVLTDKKYNLFTIGYGKGKFLYQNQFNGMSMNFNFARGEYDRFFCNIILHLRKM